MNKTALDLVPILRAIEDVKHSLLLSDAQRLVIFGEIRKSVPEPVFCPQSRLTLSIINSILETMDGSTKPAAKESAKATKASPKGKAAINKPNSKTASNTRGTRKVPSDVGKSKE